MDINCSYLISEIKVESDEGSAIGEMSVFVIKEEHIDANDIPFNQSSSCNAFYDVPGLGVIKVEPAMQRSDALEQGKFFVEEDPFLREPSEPNPAAVPELSKSARDDVTGSENGLETDSEEVSNPSGMDDSRSNQKDSMKVKTKCVLLAFGFW